MSRWTFVKFFHKNAFLGITVGTVIFFIIFIGGFIVLSYNSIWSKSSSGNIAAIPMMLSILLAPKNNIITIILGVPFERTLFWHKLFACISIIEGAFHGYIVED